MSTSSSPEMNLSRSCNSGEGTICHTWYWTTDNLYIALIYSVYYSVNGTLDTVVQLLQEFKCISTICHTWYDMLIMLYSIPFMMHFFGPSHLVIKLTLHLCLWIWYGWTLLHRNLCHSSGLSSNIGGTIQPMKSECIPTYAKWFCKYNFCNNPTDWQLWLMICNFLQII